jgi:hypothetical protein
MMPNKSPEPATPGSAHRQSINPERIEPSVVRLPAVLIQPFQGWI